MENGATNDPPLSDFLLMGNSKVILITMYIDVNLYTLVPTQTPFHQACFKNSIAMVSLFLAKGIDINLRGSKNKSPLHYAASNPNPSLKFFEFMLSKGADPNLLSEKVGNAGKTVLAAFYQSKTWRDSEAKRVIFEFLLDHGADVHLEPEFNLLAGLFQYNITCPIILFTNFVLKRLVDDGWDPLADFSRKILPVAQKLVAMGVPIAKPEVVMAAVAGPTSLLEFVLSHPSITPEILNPPNSPNVIHKVVQVWINCSQRHCDPSKLEALEKNVELLLAHGADINHPDNHSWAPIAYVARVAPGSMLNLLLSKGKPFLSLVQLLLHTS